MTPASSSRMSKNLCPLAPNQSWQRACCMAMAGRWSCLLPVGLDFSHLSGGLALDCFGSSKLGAESSLYACLLYEYIYIYALFLCNQHRSCWWIWNWKIVTCKKCSDLPEVFILSISQSTVHCAGFPGPMEDNLAAIWDHLKYDLAGLEISYSAIVV